MVEFKKQVNRLLPYNRNDYRKYKSADNLDLPVWYGISIQFKGPNKKDDVKEYLEYYMPLFKKLVSQFDDGSTWIANHHYKDWGWFPNSRKTLIRLRTLFRQNNIPSTFKGALTFTKDDLLKFSKYLITYPFAVIGIKGKCFSDLDISHSNIPVIIHISHHMNIDILTTNKELLKEVAKEKLPDVFIVKPYTGTLL